MSRRKLLSTSLATGAMALGASVPASAATKVQESCDTNYAKIDVGGGFTLMDNQWSMSNPQCIWLNDDDSYGYDFDASGYSGGPNYPEVFIGTRPWGDDTGVPEFPIRRKNVDELTMSVDADYNHSGGEWDWAEEWWLMEQPPSQQTETHKYEVMLLFDWSASHDHGAVEVENAWTDQYGNTVDHWTTYNSGGTSATFFIFRISGGYGGGKVDMKEIVDYLTNNHGISGDLYLSGIELGNEYWGGATGKTTYNSLEVTVNGSTYTSGSGSTSGGGGGSGDTTAPTAPSNLSSPAATDTSVDLDWDAASDSGGSGLDHYNVYVDGAKDSQVPAGTTSTTVSGLSAGTSYDFSVTAVDGAGNESSTSNTVTVTTSSGSSGGSSGGLTVNDYDGSPAYPGTNDLGNWCGAGSFDNSGGDGAVVSGALRLEYSGAGWYQSYVSQDVSEYTTVNLRIRGDNGGEESDFALQLGDSGGVLADMTSDTIGTSFSTVSVDLAANGLQTNLGDFYLDFWQGSSGSSAVEIERIWFE